MSPVRAPASAAVQKAGPQQGSGSRTGQARTGQANPLADRRTLFPKTISITVTFHTPLLCCCTVLYIARVSVCSGCTVSLVRRVVFPSICGALGLARQLATRPPPFETFHDHLRPSHPRSTTTPTSTAAAATTYTHASTRGRGHLCAIGGERGRHRQGMVAQHFRHTSASTPRPRAHLPSTFLER